MLKAIKNKKGFALGNPITLLGSFVVFGIVAFIFFIFFGLASKTSVYKVGIDSDVIPSGADYILLSYLKLPVEVEGQEMTMADLISLWDSDKSKYRKILESKTKEIVEGFAYEFTNEENKVYIVAYGIWIYTPENYLMKSGKEYIRAESKDFELGYVPYQGHSQVTAAFMPTYQSKGVYIKLVNSVVGKK